MNPIRVVVEPSRRWFGGRGQWKFSIVGSNGEPIDPRDTYANAADIQAIMTKLVASDTPVTLETHHRDGAVFVMDLR